MKDEIKEIIESSRKIIKSNRENGFDRIIILGDDIDKLLDCITNLQEENEKVHKDFDELSERYFFTKSRNEKAIEYIKEHIRKDDEYPAYMEMLVEEKDELLNILQGGDK